MSPYRRFHRADPRRHALHYLTSVGRRGAVLTILGALWTFMGLSVILTPPSEVYSMLGGLEHLRGAGWITTGAIALWHARKPQGEDAPGYAALYLMPAYRIVAYLVGTWEYIAGPNIGLGGSARGVVNVVIFAAILFLIAIVAGWAEPTPDRTDGQEPT